MENYAEKEVNNILAKYKLGLETAGPGEHIELELRLQGINREIFEALYSTLKSSKEFSAPILECSINFISNNVYEKNIGGKTDNTQYIRKLLYRGGVSSGDEYWCKTKLNKPVVIQDYIKYSIGLAKEVQPPGKFNTNTNALVRFKIRVSFEIISAAGKTFAPKWRVDLTAVRQGVMSTMTSDKLKQTISKLFPASLAADNLLSELNFDEIEHYEVEIEHIGSAPLAPEELNIVQKIFLMINPNYLLEIIYQDEIYHIAKYVIENVDHQLMFQRPTHRLKQLGNQVLAISKNVYYSEIYPPVGFYVTVKADGARCFVSINGNRCRLIKSDTLIEIMTGPYVAGETTIADAEFLEGNSIRIFDVIAVEGKNVSLAVFSVRHSFLPAVVEIVNKIVKTLGYEAFMAEYERLGDDLEAGIRAVWFKKYKHKIDGIILTEPNQTYSNTKNYKWKPFELNTIDFMAVKCPQKLLGRRPFNVVEGQTLFILFVGINHQMREKMGIGYISQYKSLFPNNETGYYPIQFSPSANPFAYIYYHPDDSIDRQIIELSRDKANENWIFHKIRTDRKMEKNYFGNDFRIAELTYVNYIDPFGLTDLWTSSAGYFTKVAGDIHAAPNKYKRFVISILMKNNITGAKWIIDEAAGRGADLHRYGEIGVANALFIDVDPTAISELIRRKYTFSSQKKKWIRGGGTGVDLTRIHEVDFDKIIEKDVKNLTVKALVQDLKLPADQLIASTYQFGVSPDMVDAIICNFALHYMCDTIEHIRNILTFNAKMLKIGGLFIFTVMDGRAVFDLLRTIPDDKAWTSREGEVLKYSIKKKYRGDKLSPAGQMIEVLMPFSDQMYAEPLCNIDTVIAEAARMGFEVELNASMSDFMSKFAQADVSLFNRLTEEDKKYISLYKFVSLRLVKRKNITK